MSEVPTRTPGRSLSPVHADDSGERLHERVVPRLAREWPAAAEGADRAVDETRLPLPQSLAAEAMALGRPGPHRLHDDIRDRDQP